MKLIRNNSASLIFGDTGTGKSALIGTLAEYVYEKFGKITLYYSVDGGGFPTNVEALVHKGIVWVFKLRSRGLAFETCARAAQGWWPEEIQNTITGEVSPNCKLLPPVKTEYTLICPNGHTVKKASARGVFQMATLCGTCKANTTLRNGTIEAVSVRTPGLERIGAVAFDGLTSMQAWIMTDMSNRTAAGELKGEETALGGKITSGDMIFSGSNRSHYGQAQLRAEDWVLDSTAIPGLVVSPIWTALEQRSTDRDTKLPIYGPKIAGAARTADVPSWVGNCLGTRIAINEHGDKEWRLYLSEYREDDNIPHLCKTRSMPGILPSFLVDEPDAPSFSGFNLGGFFDFLDLALEKTMKETDERFKNAPGLPSGKIGGESTVTAGGNGKTTPRVAVAKVGRVASKPATLAVRRPPSAVPAVRKVSPKKG